MRYFQVSSTGNGIGVAIIRTESGQEIILRIHPKAWRHPGASRPALVRLRPLGDRSVLTAYELDTVELTDDIADALGNCRELTLDSVEELSRNDNESSSPLLTEIVPPKSLHGAMDAVKCENAGADRQDKAMWTLISSMDQLALQDSMDLPAVLASTTVGRRPELRCFFIEEFTKLAADAVRYQRPEFQRNAGPLMAVRGKILVNALAERQAYRRQAIACEYTELTTDTTLWRTIRAALRQCLSELGTTTTRSRAARERALRADAHLSTITIASTYDVLQEPALAYAETPPGPLQNAYRAARALLSQVTGLGTARGQDAAALTIKVVTSRLWEEILRRHFQAAGYSAESEVPKLQLFENSVMSKRPDIELRHPAGGLIVVDAKYKVLSDLEPGKMSMSDQYQMYAYATQRQAPTLFIHIGEAKCRWTRTAPAGCSSYPVGVASLPFPSPESMLTYEEADNAAASKRAISELQILAEPVQREDSSAGPVF